MTAGRGCDNVVEVPEAQPRRNEVGRLPCLDILPPSEWTYTSGPPPSARSTRRRARPWRGGSAATRGARSRSGCRASRARRSPPTRAATSASPRRGSSPGSASTASSRPSPRSQVGDFSRFRSGRQVTSYFGLAPKQRSSADSVRLGGISGAGNALVRRLAVEGS